MSCEIIVELPAVVRPCRPDRVLGRRPARLRLRRGVPAVDLGQHRLGVRLAFLVFGIPPVERAQRLVHRVVRSLGLGDEPLGELVDEPRLALGVAGRLDGLFAPLEQALGVGERPLLFDVRAAGIRKTSVAMSSVFISPRSISGAAYQNDARLDLHQIAHDEPFHPRERLPLEPRVLRTHRRVLAHDEIAVHLVVAHPHDELEMRMVARQLGQPAVAEVVFLRRALAVIRLEQADEVLRRVVPQAGFLRVLLEVAGEVVRLSAGAAASTGNPAAYRRASGCRSTPGWTRARATP